MLTPRQLEDIPQRLIELYSEVENEIIKDMAKRLSRMDFIPSVEWQYKKLIDMGAVHEHIIKKLSDVSGIRVKELERLMKEAGVKAVKGDLNVYRRAGMSPSPLESSPALQSILHTGLENTNGLFENLTRSTAAAANKQFENALDRAWLNINSGAFSHNEAIRLSVKELTDKGLAAVTYPNGKKDYLDVAVRRATVTGINQTALKMQEQLADDMDTDLVEVTAHAGARTGVGIANHSEWQGKIYSRSGTHPKYPSLVEKTGYGTGEGLGGWNCRHNMFPFIEGASEPAYTQAELDKLNEPKYDYNGKKLTEYEATQQQRHIERNIRKYKREYIGMKEAGQPEAAEMAASKLSKWHAMHKDFIEQTGLKRQYGRESIVGFGKSEAAGARASGMIPEKVLRFNKTHTVQTDAERLPSYTKAEIPDSKISEYALNMNHPDGKNKAIAFEKYLGYNINNKDQLLAQVQKGLQRYRAKLRSPNKYGKPYEVSMMVFGANGNFSKVKTGWIIEYGKEIPRLTSIYVDE